MVFKCFLWLHTGQAIVHIATDCRRLNFHPTVKSNQYIGNFPSKLILFVFINFHPLQGPTVTQGREYCVMFYERRKR